MQDLEILVALERAAQLYPWDKIQLSTMREPGGEIAFEFYIGRNDKIGADTYGFGRGPTISEAFEVLLKELPPEKRDPERSRREAVAKMREAIAKLENAVFGLPPYVPNRELCERNPELQKYTSTKETIEV